MIKQVYDIMKCADGVARACKLVDGVLIDPSTKIVAEKEKEEKEEKEKPKKVISIQDRLQGKVEDFISAVEGQVDDYIDSDYKLKYDMYNHCLLYTSPSPRD